MPPQTVGDHAIPDRSCRKGRFFEVSDWLTIPAGTRHRVEWTAADEPTVWLAVHYR